MPAPRQPAQAAQSPFAGMYDGADPRNARAKATSKDAPKQDQGATAAPQQLSPAGQIRQTLGTSSPETLAAPEGLDESEQFEYYSALVRQGGGMVNPIGPDGTPLPTVLGIRGMDTTGRMHETFNSTRQTDTHEGGYDDTAVVLTVDEEGNQHVLVLPYSSHPSSRTSDAAPNVDGQGSNDMGMLRPGTYLASRERNRDNGGNYKETGMPSYRTYPLIQDEDGSVHRGENDHVPAYRDMNHDQRIDEQERQGSETRHLSPEGQSYAQVDPTYGDYADAVLFHKGWSAGCQTFEGDSYQQFVDRVGDGSFSYTLIDGNQTLADVQPTIPILE